MPKKPINHPIDADSLGFQVRESYKTARTNLVYSLFKKGCKKVVFTSSGKSEGKTVTAINVASALAQQVNTKVLVIDCDLRRPCINNALSLVPTPGLTNYLNDECSYEDIIRDTRIKNLKAVCYGAIPPNPSELLASEAMSDFIKKVEQLFDYIIIDTPPIGIVIDAIPVIKQSDGVVVIAKNNSTTYPEFDKTIEILRRADAKILGVIINKTDTTTSYKKIAEKYSYYSR